jgi:hypothetical protein
LTIQEHATSSQPRCCATGPNPPPVSPGRRSRLSRRSTQAHETREGSRSIQDSYQAASQDDLKVADETTGRQLNAVDPNLKAFEKTGGKLIIYHGWSDPTLPPMSTVNYFNRVVTKMGRRDSEGFGRLYMVPGLQHCAGGPGPNAFGGGMTAALERWVEDGVAPGAIIATKYKTDGDPASGVVRTRPLCPYPQVARYKGAGSTDEAANFTCKAP